MIAFGPVPSRRLGRSLGINNIPPKNCTYSCIYCQVGRALRTGIDRQSFYEPEAILAEVRGHLEKVHGPVDYLTFVPDGEPTLDKQLGRTICLLHKLGLPIAVISNASLVWRSDVQEDLTGADWVSLKIDTVDSQTWHRINRPNRHLALPSILAGIREFARIFKGRFVTETMLAEGVNDADETLEHLAHFLGSLKPAAAYLSIPTRPPAERSVRGPDEAKVNHAYQILSRRLARVECLTGYEGNAFASSGNLTEDVLNITAVHPLREEAVRSLVDRDHASWAEVEDMVACEQLAEVQYAGDTFYMRKWRRT